MQSSGTTVGERRTPDIIGRGETLRPREDRLLVKVLDWEPSKTIELAGSQRKAMRGIVVAVGPGTYPWVYNHDRSKRWRSKHFRETQVKVGDVVELGSLHGFSYQYEFPQVVIDNELHILPREEDVCCIVDA